jgi:GT2 family glycosyltransferase
MKTTALAVLVTVHNRKDKTLNCLSNLYLQEISNNLLLDVYLVDDGSTDGTSEAVKRDFPSVEIIAGDGNLYWNRGMYVAWEAAANTKTYDYFLWLNDDTNLFPKAVQLVLDAANSLNTSAIICGATCSPLTKEVTYSGKIKGKSVVPNGELQVCEIINGNFILVPFKIFDKIGNLDWTFRHAIGDYDYGLRAQKAGFKAFVASEYIGTCEANPTLPKWCLKTTPLLSRFRLLYSPLGYADPIPFFIYEKRHFGWVVAIKHFFAINLRALLPHLWK